ncbi:MAG: AMP-binding protein [Caulobacteraceae bacterium]|nr:AMP-binding protein [Caulobacteraceae bacterium]
MATPSEKEPEATAPLSPPPPLPPPHLHPFAGRDIRWLLESQARARGDHPMLVWEPFEGERRVFSYRALVDRIARFAAGLLARGVGPGDRVVAHASNCPELLIAWLGCGWIGAIACTTNAGASEDELRYFGEKLSPVAVIAPAPLAALARKAIPQAPLFAVIGGSAGAADIPGAIDFAEIDAEPQTLSPGPVDSLSPFSIQFTSGTTARPKGVVWTHANALFAAKVNAEHQGLQPDDAHLVYMPLFHTNAQAWASLACIWVGATIVLTPKLSVSRFWDISLRNRCTWTMSVAMLVQGLSAQPVPQHHYRMWGGGQASPPSDARLGVRTIGWWGMTETLVSATVGDRLLPNPPGVMGRPSTSYRFRIVDEDGRDLPPGEVGELRVGGQRGLSLFLEYYGDPEATAAAFDEAGYFRTGDRVSVRPDGYLVFADRAKDMLKVGGENVSAAEVERVLYQVPGVAEAAVVARRDPVRDEVPVAFLVLAPGEHPDAVRAAAEAACAAQLAPFKRPVEYRAAGALPRGVGSKILKAELRRFLALELEAGVTAPNYDVWVRQFAI